MFSVELEKLVREPVDGDGMLLKQLLFLMSL
jgi:hypothetical protein